MNKVEKVYPITEYNTSSQYNVFGDNMTFYKVLPFSDVNFGDYAISHHWSDLNMYSNVSYTITNQPYTDGGLLQSAFENLPSSFMNYGMIVGVINNDQYRVELDGYSFGVRIPMNPSYTGMTSGLSYTTLYSAFIYSPSELTINKKDLCGGTTIDTKTSESLQQFTSSLGLGSPYVQGVNPSSNSLFDSGIVYLVSDNIYKTFTGGTGSSMSWGYNFSNTTNKYALGGRTIDIDFSYTQHQGYYDTIVGLVDTKSGMFYLWDKNIVEGFQWSGFTGNPLTGVTTTSGNTYGIIQDMDTSVSLKVDIIVKPNEFTNTGNLSAIGESCNTVFTSICLYDELGNMLGVAKPDEAVTIPTDGYSPISLKLPISGAIVENTKMVTISL